ncbi:MAG: sigma-70 family RNA polymerase sigma factor [Bryobacteraceae bacterium]
MKGLSTQNSLTEARPDLRDCRDFELVAWARRGDAEAFGELTRRSARMCRMAAWAIVHDPAEMDDLIQNALLKAWRNIGFYREDAKFSTWLVRIVVNECLMAVRRRRRSRILTIEAGSGHGAALEVEIADGRPGPEERMASEQVERVMHCEISRSPAMFRDALRLMIAGHAVCDVARELGISAGAAKTRLSRARQHLRQRMIRHLGRDGVQTFSSTAVTFRKSPLMRDHPTE